MRRIVITAGLGILLAIPLGSQQAVAARRAPAENAAPTGQQQNDHRAAAAKSNSTPGSAASNGAAAEKKDANVAAARRPQAIRPTARPQQQAAANYRSTKRFTNYASRPLRQRLNGTYRGYRYINRVPRETSQGLTGPTEAATIGSPVGNAFGAATDVSPLGSIPPRSAVERSAASTP